MVEKIKKAHWIYEIFRSAKNLITRFVERNKVPKGIIPDLKYYFNYFYDEFLMENSTWGFYSMMLNISNTLLSSPREKKLFDNQWNSIIDRHHSLTKKFSKVCKNRKKDDFNEFVGEFNKLIESTTGLIEQTIALILEKEKEGIIETIVANEKPNGNILIDEIFENQREDYNHFLLHYKNFLRKFSCYHSCGIETYPLKKHYLIPKLSYTYIKKKDKKSHNLN